MPRRRARRGRRRGRSRRATRSRTRWRRPGPGRAVRASTARRAARPLTALNERAARRASRSPRSNRSPSRASTAREVEAFLTKPLGLRRRHALPADRDDPRRAARPAGAGVQQQGAGLRRARLGDADGELPRARPATARRSPTRSSRTRTAARRRTCSPASTRRWRRYPWIDPERLGVEGGSYGGQLTNWIITQTDRFKAAIPIGGHLEPRQLQLHGLLPRLPGGRVRRVSRTRAT